MKVVLLFALLVLSTMAVGMKRPMTNQQIAKYQSILKDNKWASIMMNMAELQVMSEGPLDELIDAINSVVDDIERKWERADNEYAQRTEEHNAEVTRINGEIDSANSDISATTEFLNNVLYVQRANLEEEIANLEQSIANAQQELADAATLRASQHESYLKVIIEHEEATAAVDEALEILSSLRDGASLLQVKKAKKSLDNVTSKLKKSTDAQIIKSLIALTSGEFANSEAIQKVADLLNEVRNNLGNSKIQYTAEEHAQQDAYSAFVTAKTAEINQFTLDLTDRNAQLEQTNRSIADNEEFLAQRQNDLRGYEQDLVDENARFDEITAIYNDLVAQLQAEHNACHEALSVLQSADIAGYIGNRMEQDVIIDTAHGTGLTVEDKFDEFQ